MTKNLIRNITESGVVTGDDYRTKRSIVLSNYIALLLIAANVLIFIIIPENHNFGGFYEMLVGISIFALPVLLNRFSMTNASRLYLCWVPLAVIIAFMIAGMKETQLIPASTYDGLRFYILAIGCIPFLLIDKKDLWLMIAGIIPGFFLIISIDAILNYFDVGFYQKGSPDEGYSFTLVRSFISYVVITGSCFSLKLINERVDTLNQKLMVELDEKNKLIRQQANEKLFQMNRKLMTSLDDLSAREFILNQSQKIARIGSWEYRIENAFLFWSDEMYNIFGLDKSFDVRTGNLTEALGKEATERITNATIGLLRDGNPYDLSIRTRTPLGYVKWFRVYAFPIIDNSHVIGVRGICHDITFFKEAEEKLRSGEIKFSKAFENNPDLIMIVRESDFLVIDINQRVTPMLGFDKTEVIGRSAKDMDLFLKEEDGQQFIQSYADRGYTEFECSWRRKDARVIDVRITAVRMDIEGQYFRMSVVQDITEKKRIERENAHTMFLLSERMKELTTLYRSSQVLHNDQNTVDEALQEIALLLPGGWQFNEIAAVCIRVNGLEFCSPGFRRTDHMQHTEFKTPEGGSGKIDVVYLEAVKEKQDTFLQEEQDLLNMVGEMIQVYLFRKHKEEALNKSEANLNSTINNTEILIWSVDPDFKIITFNKPFFEYVKRVYGVEVQPGRKILESSTERFDDLEEKWIQNYRRALAGEIVTLEDRRVDIDFRYSLSPIIEEDKIIGVSVFADNVTERKNSDRELSEANKKIGELKLMALRSVMNPHFIFNVLNSIQFFIANNDRLNAINYLSTFSKLIRSILAHSVDNNVRLSAEIEMLKNYVQLEMVRFENKFDFNLNVDPEIDQEAIGIPSLLIQPFVENAILHGLYNKKSKGVLSINVREESEMLLFEIEDNGVGREAAKQLQTQNFRDHKSMGIKLTEERLKLINQHPHTAVKTIDLFDEQGHAAGTRVIVRIKHG